MGTKDIAENFLLQYLQSWGQTVDDKMKALNKVVAAAGINATFGQDEENGEQVAWIDCDNKEDGEKAQKLREELTTGWMLGNFQAEAKRIETIISKYDLIREIQIRRI